MSDPTTFREPTDLKAGHAPAIKVGGMRIAGSRPRQTSQGDDKDKILTGKDFNQDSVNGVDNEDPNKQHENQQEFNEEEQASGSIANRVAGQMVSGTFVSVQKAFPTEAVKHIHEKPGSHSKTNYHKYSKHDEQRFLNQPRKQ